MTHRKILFSVSAKTTENIDWYVLQLDKWPAAEGAAAAALSQLQNSAVHVQ